jgi:hypothetical protein
MRPAKDQNDRQITVVLLGTNEEMKHFVGTTILSNSTAFSGKLKNQQKPTSCISLFTPSPFTPPQHESIHLVYTPTCTKKDKEGGLSLKLVVKYLQKKVRFVHGFVLVLHGHELEARNYDLLLVLLSFFLPFFFFFFN